MGTLPCVCPGRSRKGPGYSGPLTASACQQFAGTEAKQAADSCLHPWRCGKGSTVGSSTSLVTVRDQSSQLRNMPVHASSTRWPTSVWAVEPEVTLVQGQSYPTFNKNHPAIRQQLSQGPGGSHTCCTPGSRPTV